MYDGNRSSEFINLVGNSVGIRQISDENICLKCGLSTTGTDCCTVCRSDYTSVSSGVLRLFESSQTPQKDDWGDAALWSFEVQYGFEKFFEKSLREILDYFENALLISETLSALPEVPLRFYFSFFLEHLIQDRASIDELHLSNMASSAFFICERGLRYNELAMLNVMPDVLSQIEFIADNQDLFDSYSNGPAFKDELIRIKHLISEANRLKQR